MKQMIVAVFVAGLFVACAGTNFDWNNARKLEPGMTQAQVTELMGSPYMVTSMPGRTIWVWSWATALGSTKTLSITFVDGKLAGVPEIPESF